MEDNKIKILHIVTIMDVGGIETMLMNYLRKIDLKKFEFSFLVHRREAGFYDSELQDYGCKIYYLPAIKFINIKEYIKKCSAFFLNHSEFDIIHSHLDSLSFIPLYFAKKNGYTRLIAHSHCNNFDYNSKYFFRVIAKKLTQKTANNFIACSSEAGKYMFNNKKFFILKNGIDVNKFKFSKEKRDELRKKLNVEDKFVVGHIGRFNTVKNHVFLIDVFYELKKIEPKSVLLLIGVGPEQEIIKKKCIRLKLDRDVIFLNLITDTYNYLNVFDIFLLPSIYEGLGIVAIEAQCNGLPCLLSDKVAEEANLTNLVTRLSLEKNPNEWAKTCFDIFQNKERSYYFLEIKEQKYDINENVKKLEKFYFDLLKNKK